MLLALAGLALVVALLVVAPGLLFVNALFPPGRGRITGLERGYLAVTCGIALVILVGVTLGFLPHGEGRGMFQTLGTGLPNVEVALLVLSVLFFYVGLQRGAYPAAERWLEARFPQALAWRPGKGRPQS